MKSLEYSENLKTYRYADAWIIYLRRGNATISHMARKIRNSVVKPRSIVVLPPGRSEKTEFQVINPSIRLLPGLWLEIHERLRSSGIPMPTTSTGYELCDSDAIFISNLFERLSAEIRESDLFLEEYCSNIVENILLLCCRRENSNPENKTLWTIADAMSYIETHLEEQFSLEFFAGKCAMNTASFSRDFKDITGYPLFEYINRMKIRHACSMLKRDDTSVLDIATQLGYNNISFFNRYFRKVTGLTPSAFRKLT